MSKQLQALNNQFTPMFEIRTPTKPNGKQKKSPKRFVQTMKASKPFRILLLFCF